MLPRGRLVTLTAQAVRAQRRDGEALDNAPHVRSSLFQDFRPTLADLPTRCAQTLREHGGQVGDARFSPDGTLLASSGQDGSVIIWTVRPVPRLLDELDACNR